MKYYSTGKGNEKMIHSTMYMNLKNILLIERSQTQKPTFCASIYVKCPK